MVSDEHFEVFRHIYLDILCLGIHLYSLSPPLCDAMESQVFSVHAVTGDETTYSFNYPLKGLHLPSQNSH